jgi:hypothetical protein
MSTFEFEWQSAVEAKKILQELYKERFMIWPTGADGWCRSVAFDTSI